MLKKLGIGVLTALLLVTTFSGAVFAQAEPPNPPEDPQDSSARMWSGRRVGNRIALEALAEILDMTTDEIRSALQDGQTVLELAEAQGMTEEEVEAALQAAAEERVQQALADGKITEEQADAMLERVANAEFPWLDQTFDRNPLVDGLAEFLGMTSDELKAAREDGQTLEEILESQGKTMDELKAYAQEKAEERIQQALADGKITQEQADAMLERMADGGFPRPGQPFGDYRPAEGLAEFLGMTSDEVKDALQDGQTVEELLESQGRTMEELQAYGQAKTEDRVGQALADGKITQEQADKLLERIESGNIRPRQGVKNFVDRVTDSVFGKVRERLGNWMQGLGK